MRENQIINPYSIFMMLRFSYLFLMFMACVLLGSPDAVAQDSTGVKYTYVNARDLSVLGQSATVRDSGFHRIDAAERPKLPNAVARLATNSAGISVSFQTNSKSIKLKWRLAKYNTLWNMTPAAVNGLDLYAWNGKEWQYAATARPAKEQNDVLVLSNLDGQLRHYRVHLPLYAAAEEVHVGVEAGSTLQKADARFLPTQKVVIYGSSITQGASASRPGMAYPAILSRQLNLDIYNLGFSGSGKMEMALAEVLGQMDADVYVLDCVPNPSPEQIRERAVPFIKRLRELKPHTPILMVESVFRESTPWDQEKRKFDNGQNEEFRKAYEQLKQEKYKNLYYLSAKDLPSYDHEGTIDGSHLSDLGFMRVAPFVGKKLKKILPKK
ncbi:hydrolase [Rufibacter immobilis]|uniref:Hydrolase n=1 Tax=Rufibacter immobilis TaxID=1348778 RepID=A0A3M9MYL6_9BACT|nr:SGNH/GDSL hydrolase family protein [Rufibacter immobilis]RNI29983.1 hydrolase [Rufibacter immobilis]